MRPLPFPVRRERVARLGARHDLMNEEARRRLDLLGFRERHGLVAAADHGGVSIRTVYRWRAAYRRSGTEGLVPGSRRPTGPGSGNGRRRCLPRSGGCGSRTRTCASGRSTRCCAERGRRGGAVVTIGRLIADAGGLRAIWSRLDNRRRMKRPRPKSHASPTDSAPRVPRRSWIWTPYSPSGTVCAASSSAASTSAAGSPW